MSGIPLSMMRPVTGGNRGRGGDYREVTKLIHGLSSDSEQEQFSLPPLELCGSGSVKFNPAQDAAIAFWADGKFGLVQRAAYVCNKK